MSDITEKPRYWTGKPPLACELCDKPITTSFVNGAMKGRQTWAYMCLYCSRVHGSGVRSGVGNLYRCQDDGRFLKTEA